MNLVKLQCSEFFKRLISIFIFYSTNHFSPTWRLYFAKYFFNLNESWKVFNECHRIITDLQIQTEQCSNEFNVIYNYDSSYWNSQHECTVIRTPSNSEEYLLLEIIRSMRIHAISFLFR